MTDLCIYNTETSESVQRVLHSVRDLVTSKGYSVGICQTREAAIAAESVIVAHQPLDVFPAHARMRVLGERTLNRRQRHELLSRLGVPSPRWAAPANKQQLDRLFSQWNESQIILKYDWSARRSGVVLVSQGDAPRFDPKADIFMEILRGSPVTYKVDVFAGLFVGARMYHTEPIASATFRNPYPRSTEYTPTTYVLQVAESIGRELLSFGAGYISVDFMLNERDVPVVIEVNTCDVGIVTPWTQWPCVYAQRYGNAILRWLGVGRPVPTIEEVARSSIALDCALHRRTS